MRITISRLYLNRGLHVAGWLLYFTLNVNFFYSFGILNIQSAVIRSFLLALLFSAIFYTNSHVLIPRYLNRRKMGWYFLILAVVVAFGTIVRLRLEKMFVNENFPELARVPNQRIGFVAGTIIILLLLSTAYRLLMDHLRSEDQQKEILKEKVDAELKFLKTQVNPHFLFNTLNNLYALAYSGSEQTAAGIMALSQMMRYLLYETSREKVSLSSEIAFVMNYIELEKLRIENSGSIKVVMDESKLDLMVAPLIFIPFIENSFKHSRIIDDPEAWINISLKTEKGRIIFTCSNSVPEKQFKKDKNGGVGLANIRKRLMLIYPDRHKVSFIHDASRFSAELEIMTDEN